MIADGVLASSDAGQAGIAALRAMRQLSLGAIEIGGLWILNLAGVWIVQALALPIPGNLVGMALLYGLLTLGVIRLSWLETAGSFLIRHLPFFFVPITVGLMNSGALFATRGIGIIVTLVVSAAIGLILTGWASQLLFVKRSQWEAGHDRAFDNSRDGVWDCGHARGIRIEPFGAPKLSVAADYSGTVQHDCHYRDTARGRDIRSTSPQKIL